MNAPIFDVGDRVRTSSGAVRVVTGVRVASTGDEYIARMARFEAGRGVKPNDRHLYDTRALRDGREFGPVRTYAQEKLVADNGVLLLDERQLVTAYIGAGDPYALDNRAIILATATRYTRAEGAEFSGWVVRNESDGSYSDPIGRKADAVAQLREVAAPLVALYLDSVEG